MGATILYEDLAPNQGTLSLSGMFDGHVLESYVVDPIAAGQHQVPLVGPRGAMSLFPITALLVLSNPVKTPVTVQICSSRNSFKKS